MSKSYKIFESEDKAKELLRNGEPRLIRADGQEICIVRLDKELFAFDNACPHMGENLHKGNTNHIHEIVCPLHTYRFNMKTGEESSSRCRALKIYTIMKQKDGLYLEV